MLRFVRLATFGISMLVLTPAVQAGTIFKLDLGSDSAPDIEYTGGAAGVLSTADDGNPTMAGDQATEIDFLDFLERPSIQGSFSLHDLAAAGTADNFGGFLVIQNFSGGTLSLYDSANVLLLSGSLGNSTLAGPIGPPATGALFTTSFASVTGGSLQSSILDNTLTLSMSLTDINSGLGFDLSNDTPPLLNPFEAGATLNIAGQPIPEPISSALLSVGSVLAAWACRRR
jgi:hypothetical protein